jgi:hypothetical protein
LPHYITVPTTGSRNQLLKEVEVQSTFNWKEKHLKMIKMNYGKTPFFEEVFPLLENIYKKEDLQKLSEFNIKIIKAFASYLDLDTVFHSSSELNINAPRTQRLIEITKSLNAEQYYSPIGSKEYIDEDGNFVDSEVKLKFQSFTPKPYSQYKTKEFIPYMSVLDICCNLNKKDIVNYLRFCS